MVVEEEEDVEKEEVVVEEEEAEVVVVEGGGACQAVSMVTSEVPPRSPSAPSPSPSSLQAPVRSLEGWAGPALGAGRVGLRILSWRW